MLKLTFLLLFQTEASLLCGAGTAWRGNRCVPDRMRLCGEGTILSSTECVAVAPPPTLTTATLRTAFPEDSVWFDVPSEFVERRRFRRVEDESIVRTLESIAASDYRVDDAQGCGWDVRQRTVVTPPCLGAPVLADCWSWSVAMTTNPMYATTSECDEADLGTELWDVETGLATGVHLDVTLVERRVSRRLVQV